MERTLEFQVRSLVLLGAGPEPCKARSRNQ